MDPCLEAETGSYPSSSKVSSSHAYFQIICGVFLKNGQFRKAIKETLQEEVLNPPRAFT